MDISTKNNRSPTKGGGRNNLKGQIKTTNESTNFLGELVSAC